MIALPDGGWLQHDENFLPPADADALLAAARADLAWEQRAVVIFGRPVMQPRLVAWGGPAPYRYSGQTLEPRPLPPAVARALAQVVARTGVPFDHVLANRYRDGRDSMGFHADDEPELGPDPVVATLSLGATRRFVVKARRGSHRLALDLAHGSLLVMGGACQRHHHHGLPKQASVTGERISLTFRHIRAPAQNGQ